MFGRRGFRATTAAATRAECRRAESPRFPLKGSFEGDTDMGRGVDRDMDTDSDMAVSTNSGGLFWGCPCNKGFALWVYIDASDSWKLPYGDFP